MDDKPNSPARAYCVVSGIVFALVAALHLVRAFLGLPAVVGALNFDPSISWIGALAAGALSAWAFLSSVR